MCLDYGSDVLRSMQARDRAEGYVLHWSMVGTSKTRAVRAVLSDNSMGQAGASWDFKLLPESSRWL